MGLHASRRIIQQLKEKRLEGRKEISKDKAGSSDNKCEEGGGYCRTGNQAIWLCLQQNFFGLLLWNSLVPMAKPTVLTPMALCLVPGNHSLGPRKITV